MAAYAVIDGNGVVRNRIEADPARVPVIAGHTVRPWQGGDAVTFDRPVPTLAEAKRAKAEAVDAKSAALLAQGVEIDGHAFPLDPASQTIWLGILAFGAKNPFPILLTATDGTVKKWGSWGQMAPDAQAALARFREVVDAGAAIKADASECETVGAVAAIVDDRT